jgi:hypothetical protein
MGEPPLVFTGLLFGIYLGLPSEKYKIVSWKKKEFEDLEDLLVSSRLYFVIVKDSSCNSKKIFKQYNESISLVKISVKRSLFNQESSQLASCVY